MKINKKGESESSSTGSIVAMVIAVIVLVIVVIALYSFFSGNQVWDWLPSFNNTQPRVTNLEILGYSLKDDKVQFYDGTAWTDFKKQGSVELNGKVIRYSSGGIYEEFFNYYYGRNNVEKRYSSYYDKNHLGLVAKLVTSLPGKMDHYAIDLNNKEFYLNNGEFSETSPTAFASGAVRQDLIDWRDSIVNEPVSISYTKDGKGTTEKFCLDKEKYNVDKRLVIYLDNPFRGAEGAKCS